MARIEDVMFELDQLAQQHGHGPLSPDTLRELSRTLQHPAVQQGLDSGQITPQSLFGEAQQAIQVASAKRRALQPQLRPIQGAQTPTNLAPFAEGGLINDQGGVATQRIRRQYRLGGGR